MSERWSFPWEDQASRGLPVPDGLTLTDRMAYRELRCIYREFREKRISREQASCEKNILRRDWEQAQKGLAFDRKLTAHHARLIRAVEQAVSTCRKDPTPENAIRLCDVIDGLDLAN